MRMNWPIVAYWQPSFTLSIRQHHMGIHWNCQSVFVEIAWEARTLIAYETFTTEFIHVTDSLR